MTIRQAASLMRGRAVKALPVFEQQRLVGIVTVSDLLDLLGNGVVRFIEASPRRALRRSGATEGGASATRGGAGSRMRRDPRQPLPRAAREA